MEFYQKQETNRIRIVCGWIVDLAVAVAFAWFCLTFFCGQVFVSGQSMQPVLESGDVVLVNRLLYEFSDPKRLDIVVFERADKKVNIKRVIGLPGETILIENGLVTVDGEVLDPQSLAGVTLAGLAADPITLGEDEYFLLGDNRESSEDSRFSNVGNVKREQIEGKIWLRLSPFIRFGLISSRPEEDT